MRKFLARRRLVPWFLVAAAVFLTAVLATACGTGWARTTGEQGKPGDASGLHVAVQSRYEAGGLVIRVDGITMRSDRVLVNMTVRNPSSGQKVLLLGGCGPSQGAVSTGDRRYEMYYQTSTGDDLTRGIPPGTTKRTRVVLMFKSGEMPNPGEATHLEFHPGYVMEPRTGWLHYVEMRIPLPPAGSS